MRFYMTCVVGLTSAVAMANDEPTVANAGGPRCSLGPEIALTTFFTDTEGGAAFTLTPAGGMVVGGNRDHWTARPLAPDGRPRGKTVALDSRPSEVVAAGSRFLVLGPCPNGNSGCVRARWLEADGSAGKPVEVQLADRSLLTLHNDGERVVAIATRPVKTAWGRKASNDLWLAFTRGADAAAAVQAVELDLGEDVRLHYQDDDAGGWFVAESFVKDQPDRARSVATLVDAAGKATAVTGWPDTSLLLETTRGHRVLVRAERPETVLLDERIDAFGKAIELARAPFGRVPSPFSAHVSASTTGRGGVSLERSMIFRQNPDETLLTNALSVTPYETVWSGGTFYPSYIVEHEGTKQLWVRAARCEER
jgi:hypothetical protein